MLKSEAFISLGYYNIVVDIINKIVAEIAGCDDAIRLSKLVKLNSEVMQFLNSIKTTNSRGISYSSLLISLINDMSLNETLESDDKECFYSKRERLKLEFKHKVFNEIEPIVGHDRTIAYTELDFKKIVKYFKGRGYDMYSYIEDKDALFWSSYFREQINSLNIGDLQ